MSTVLLILQAILSVVLTILILIQRSEGGALGIGGGGGGGGLMSGRSAATNVVRMTTIVGAVFVLNCVALTVVFNMENRDTSILDVSDAPAPLTRTLDSGEQSVPTVEEIIGTDTPDDTPLTPTLEDESDAETAPDE